MAGFEIGSIFASLKLENKEALNSLRQTATAAKDWGKRVGQQTVAVSKKFKEALKVDDKGLGASLGRIGRRIEKFKAALGRTSQIDILNEKSFLSKLHRANLAVRRTVKRLNRKARVSLGLDPKKTVTSFRIIEAAGRKAGKTIKKSFTGIKSIFRRLRRSIFGIQGLLLQIGAGLSGLALINRAKDVEQLGTAFQNLTRSIGGTSETFLGKLRVATRGAVSDMELMKTANNAVLLGVAKNEEQFAELAVVARRLGQAVGRDAVDSINDLAVGIGRQSRLILDNLGLIVKVEKANEAYALSLGKSVDAMTDAERRQAFFNAAMTAGRAKVKELGDDVPTLGQAWGRFTASLSNTINVVAEAFTGTGGLNAISTWLTENTRKIAIFARFIARVVVGLVKSVAKLIGGLFEGEGFSGFTKKLAELIGNILDFLVTLLIEGLAAVFSTLTLYVIKLIGLLFVQLASSIADKLAQMVNTLHHKLAKLMTELFAKIPGVSKLLGLDDPEVYLATLDAIDAASEVKAKKIAARVKRLNDGIKAEMDDTTKVISGKLAVIAGKALESLEAKAGTNEYIDIWLGNINLVKDEINRLNLDLANIGSEQKDLKLALPLQGLANDLNAIIETQARGIEVGSKFGDKVLNAEIVEEQSGKVRELREELLRLNEIFGRLRVEPDETRALSTQAFILEFNTLQEKLQDTDLTAAKFNRTLALQAIQLGASKEDIDLLEDAFGRLLKQIDKTSDVADVLDIATAPKFLSEEEFGKKIQGLQEQLPKLELEAKLIGLDDTEKQLKQIEIAFVTLRKEALDPGQLEKVDALEKALTGAIRQISGLQNSDKAAKAVEQLDKAIAGLNDQLKLSSADPLAKSLADLDRQLKEQIVTTGATGDALVELKERFDTLGDLTVSMRLQEFEQRLTSSRQKLKALGETEIETRLRVIREEFDRLKDVLQDQPEALERMEEAFKEISSTEVKLHFGGNLQSLRDAALQAGEELANLTKGPIQRIQEDLKEEIRKTYIESIDRMFEKDGEEAMRILRELGLQASGTLEDFMKLAEVFDEDLIPAIEELEKLGGLQIDIEVEEALNQIRDIGKEFRLVGEDAFQFDEAKRRISEVEDAINPILVDLTEWAETNDQIQDALERIFRLYDALGETTQDIEISFERQEFADLTHNMAGATFKGIHEGLKRGEKASKVWADISADLLGQATEKMLDDLTNSVTESLGKVFDKLGSAFGIEGGLGGIATGLMGMAGLLLQSIDDRSTSTVDDFENQVNSSEAIRGVVAGPTNIAISKVNEGMKEALRTSEILLERIALAVEGGGGGGGGSLAGMRNASFPLTGSSS